MIKKALKYGLYVIVQSTVLFTADYKPLSVRSPTYRLSCIQRCAKVTCTLAAIIAARFSMVNFLYRDDQAARICLPCTIPSIGDKTIPERMQWDFQMPHFSYTREEFPISPRRGYSIPLLPALGGHTQDQHHQGNRTLPQCLIKNNE